MNVRNKSLESNLKRCCIVLFSLVFSFIFLSAFFHTHDFIKEIDECQLCYLIVSFQNIVFQIYSIFITFILFFGANSASKFYHTKFVLISLATRAPPRLSVV